MVVSAPAMRTLSFPPVIALSLALCGGAWAACTSDVCPDQEAVDTLRADIAETCDCASATSHKKYMKCVRGAIKDAIKAGTITKKCKKLIRGCEGASTCGREGAAVCCEMDPKASVVKASSA